MIFLKFSKGRIFLEWLAARQIARTKFFIQFQNLNLPEKYQKSTRQELNCKYSQFEYSEILKM